MIKLEIWLDDEDEDLIRKITSVTVYKDRSGAVGLHRLIGERMGILEDGYVVDHKDGNPLNNMRSNLRKATLTENGRKS